MVSVAGIYAGAAAIAVVGAALSTVENDPSVTKVLSDLLNLRIRLRLVWADGQQTKVSYDAPETIARRRGLTSELAANLPGTNALTDGLVTP